MLKAVMCVLLCASALAASGCATSHVEEAPFSVRTTQADFEVRDYGPLVLAETTVEGGAWNSRFDGFTPLADYIFAKKRSGDTIAMTAPVTQAPARASGQDGDAWTIAFVMPAGMTLETMPPTNDPRVRLVETRPRTMAVHKFTGMADAGDMARAETRLREWIAGAGLTPRGDAEYAFFDPPWTMPFLRRNEVMIEVTDARSAS